MNAESTPVSFIDTNVLVYALAGKSDARSFAAQELLRNLMQAQKLRTSTQVLQETFVVLTTKARTPLPPRQALEYIDQFAAWPVIVTDYGAVRDAVELCESTQISFWDSLIVIAAARSGAKRLFTADLNNGQIIRGVEIVNPFRSSR